MPYHITLLISYAFLIGNRTSITITCILYLNKNTRNHARHLPRITLILTIIIFSYEIFVRKEEKRSDNWREYIRGCDTIYIIHQRSKRTKNVLFLFYYTFVVKEENWWRRISKWTYVYSYHRGKKRFETNETNPI